MPCTANPSPSPRPLRLFVALWPDEATRAALAAAAEGWSWPSQARRYAAEDWHVTLHFLGPVAPERLPELTQALALPWTPLAWTLDQARLWPRGLAVLVSPRPAPPLAALHRRLGRALRALGLTVSSRPWQPHVTLARHAAAAQPAVPPAPIRWPVESFVLVHSTGQTSPRYRILHRFTAAPAPAVKIGEAPIA